MPLSQLLIHSLLTLDNDCKMKVADMSGVYVSGESRAEFQGFNFASGSQNSKVSVLRVKVGISGGQCDPSSLIYFPIQCRSCCDESIKGFDFAAHILDQPI